MQTSGHSKCDQAEVCLREEMDDENNDLLDPCDCHDQHLHETVDGSLNSLSSELIGALGHVVGHASHGGSDILD